MRPCCKQRSVVRDHFKKRTNNKTVKPVIATKDVSERHTGQNIAATLTNIFNEWNIVNKIIIVVSTGQILKMQ